MSAPRSVLPGLAAAIAIIAATPAPATASAIRFGAPVTAIARCSSCYEPSVAVDRAGRIFVTDAWGDAVAVSTNGGSSFVRRPPPPTPAGGSTDALSDAIVQIDPRGRLVYSRLLLTGVQIAVSSTSARTWDWDSFVGLPGATAPLADRQWVGFGPRGAVYVFWRTAT